MEFISSLNSTINGFVWGPVMLVLLVGTGVYFSVRIGFPQFRRFKYAMKNTGGKIFEKTEAAEGEITPFQAVSTALASTVGTGNIAGVTAAVMLGGPGAVFWMWVSALFGMVTKFSEVTLAIKYREKNVQGDWVGGPMYYIKNGMGERWKWLGMIFAVLGSLACFGIGNLTQINSIASSVNSVAQAFVPAAVDYKFVISLVTGIVVAAFAAFTLLGGIKGIAAVTEKLVPFMALAYIVCALIVVFVNITKVPGVIADIFRYAFNPQAVIGGTFGAALRLCITKGISRGVFSNEAGLGSAPIAHAASSETNPVKQGLYGIFEVFVDTILICSLTAITVLVTGANEMGGEAGAGTTILAFQSVLGDKLGSLILAVGLACFAISTILGWSIYGVRCAEFLFGSKVIRIYQVIFILVIILGSVTKLELVWDVSDTLNGLMAIPNLIALLALSPVVIKLANEHFRENK